MLSLLKANGRWLALGALVLLNVVVITLLLVRQVATSAVPAPLDLPPASSLSPSPSPSASSTPTPSSSPTPSASAKSPSPGPRRLMAANSAKIAWRAEEGDCAHRSTVEVTTDGGRTWRKTDPGIRGIVRLRSYGTNSVFAVGADKDCKPTYASISSPADTWRRDQSIIFDAWFRYPNDKARVHAPGGRTFRPCGGDVVSFAGIGSYQAAALCADGRIRTIGAGRGWRTVSKESGALAINADDSGFVVAQPSSACANVRVRRFDANGTGLKSAKPCGATIRASTAVHGSTTWTWNDNETLVS